METYNCRRERIRRERFIVRIIVDMLKDFETKGDLEQIARKGMAFYDTDGEMAAEHFFEDMIGTYGAARAVIRRLAAERQNT
jgi:hypothetical protein